MIDRIYSLKNFINFLHYHKIIDKNLIQEESDAGFRNRLKLQKFVYLGQEKFGLDLGYDFSMYKHGPYSPELANDYYDEDINLARDDDYYELPEQFLESEFLNIVGDANEKWLETAATLLSLNYRFQQQDKLIERTANMKSHIEKDYISETYDEMLNYGLIEIIS